MKNMFLAALAVLSLGVAVVPAAHAQPNPNNSTFATRMQQTGQYSKQ